MNSTEVSGGESGFKKEAPNVSPSPALTPGALGAPPLFSFTENRTSDGGEIQQENLSTRHLLTSCNNNRYKSTSSGLSLFSF